MFFRMMILIFGKGVMVDHYSGGVSEWTDISVVYFFVYFDVYSDDDLGLW